MRRIYFEKWKARLDELQTPSKEIIGLNVETFQKLSYLKPEELSQLKNPEDFLEKNVQIFIQNSHQVLNYLQKLFDLYEKNLLIVMKDYSLDYSPFYHPLQSKRKTKKIKSEN